MPRRSINVRRFKSEGEEAGWYATPEGRRQTQREFARALRAGTLSRSPGLKLRKPTRESWNSSWNKPGKRNSPHFTSHPDRRS
jgi:hypothetical protein